MEQLGLIGYPIKHSLSPWIHTKFLENTNFKGSYSIFEAREDDLLHLVQTMKDKGVRGFNVTIPYKQKIIPMLDELDPTAMKIGAVNTVLNHDGRLIGYNTDGIGFLRSLEISHPEVVDNKKIKILLVGAGGAARGIYYALKQAGYLSINITNRTIEKAELIVGRDKSACISLKDAERNLQEYDLIIQTTNVGMRPNEENSPLYLHNLKSTAIVSDIVYQPIWTKFLKEAEAKGAKVHHGYLMLLYQAQFAFEIWFGIVPPLNEMDKQLKQLLEG